MFHGYSASVIPPIIAQWLVPLASHRTHAEVSFSNDLIVGHVSMRHGDSVRCDGPHLEDNLFLLQWPIQASGNSGAAGVFVEQKPTAHASASSGGEFYEQCKVDKKGDCAFPSLAKNKPTVIYPSGNTVCYDGSPYAFAVFPGSTRKLVLYFGGGGACFSNSPLGMVCWKNVDHLLEGIERGTLGGIFNQSNEQNPYREHTSIYLTHCSGDSHLGNTSRPSWPAPFNAIVGEAQQRGFANARAVIDWALSDFGHSDGGALISFIVAGTSAGVLGVRSWSRIVLDQFKYMSAAVLMDSYVGVFPQGAEKQIVKAWNACDTGLFDTVLTTLCQEGTLTSTKIALASLDAFPSVPFVEIASKFDRSLMSFYTALALALTSPSLSDVLIPTNPYDQNAFYGSMSIVLADLSTRPNFHAYIIASTRHAYLFVEDAFFTATPAGVQANSRRPSLVTYIAELTGSSSTPLGNECEGVLLPPPFRKAPLPHCNTSACVLTYCTSELVWNI